MKTTLALLLLASACAGSADDATKPYINATQCPVPSGRWTVTSATLTTPASSECQVSVGVWDFDAAASTGSLGSTQCLADATNQHQLDSSDYGCHTQDTFGCTLQDSHGTRADAFVQLKLDHVSDSELSGTMRVAFDLGSVGKCDGTYSVTLTKE